MASWDDSGAKYAISDMDLGNVAPFATTWSVEDASGLCGSAAAIIDAIV